MSHVITVDLEVKDLDALDLACKDLGLELVQGQKTYKWFGRSVGDYPIPVGFKEQDLGKCEHAIRDPQNKNAYEIGVVRSRTGEGYQLIYDFYNRGYGMQDKVGARCEKVKQPYAARLAERHWQKKGFRVTTTTLDTGEIVVKARR